MIAPTDILPGTSPGRCPITGADAPAPRTAAGALRPDPDRVEAEAHEYLLLLEREGVLSTPERAERMAQIEAEVRARGTYQQSYEELAYGAKLAWRNSARCIGRLYWQKLEVRDHRHLTSAEDVFDALVDHLRDATNGGKIRPMISVFAPQEPGTPGVRIWNPQLIRYAGYAQPDGSVVGDPAMVEFTDVLKRMGWAGGPGTHFDVLPVVIQAAGQRPRFFELPPEVVLEVPLSHPDFPWFAELGLKWHALPAISGMRLEVGGVPYPSAPFNGWYMGTEIGARNFGDTDRYNLLPEIARRMGLDVRSNRSLWRDRALVELNVAVLHSFHEAGVAMVDHHTASRHFLRHEEFEQQADRTVPAEWSWIVPPISGSATGVFHREYHDTLLRPNYFYQSKPWEGIWPAFPAPPTETERDGLTGLMHRSALDRRLPNFARDGGAVVLVDLDDFGEINAAHGQVVGNALLRAAGRALLGAVRPDDQCARFGGDAFCILLPGVDSGSIAQLVATRIQRALLGVLLEEAPGVELRASVGVALAQPGDDGPGVLARAEAALREAKATMRGGIVLDQLALLAPGPRRPAEPVAPPRARWWSRLAGRATRR